MKKLSVEQRFALVFGLFLGLCVWKFGNPVILGHIIAPPTTATEWLREAWPPHWANWLLLPLVAFGAWRAGQNKIEIRNPKSEIRKKSEARSPKITGATNERDAHFLGRRWFRPSDFGLLSGFGHSDFGFLVKIALPLAWLGWQLASATQTVDAHLTAVTLWQFFGCGACYFLGALVFARAQAWRWLLPGLLAALAFCLVRAVDQRLYEFPQDRQVLVEGERTGWTNFPPETVAQWKRDNIIITTNGVDIASPVMLNKFARGRVFGTLVYPNALAGVILLLLPVALALVFGTTKKLKPLIRRAAIALTLFLGGAAFYWSGSKLGWLIGIGLIGVYLLRMNWSRQLKLAAVLTVTVLGLGIFALRFQHYFATGAHSTGARLEYWQAAVQTTAAHPLFGTGPGTFQRPYAQIKTPEAEMARLTHNDYLEQFSDSGVIGGLTYAAWIMLALLAAGKNVWRSHDALAVAVFIGLLGWFAQGLGEFSLYIPALAWTAFTLLGSLVGRAENRRNWTL